MRRILPILLTFAVAGFYATPVAQAVWKANKVRNETTENVYVVYSTWRGAKGEVPAGFRTRGYWRISPGQERSFYAWSKNNVYFCFFQYEEAIKPEASTPTFRFWVHPEREFTVVSRKINAFVGKSGLTHSSVDRGDLVPAEGFRQYSNGSRVTITSDWVPVNVEPAPPDAPGEDQEGNILASGGEKSVVPTPGSTEGMVLIPAGQFQMGSNDADAAEVEQPVHPVSVDAFYMDAHLVTNEDYRRFVLANPEWQKGRIPDSFQGGAEYLHHWTGNDYLAGEGKHPVVHVPWYAAMAYAQWLGKRLPTEAEWEYAARGGLEGRKYPWGNAIDPGRANYDSNVGGTTPVGQYPANGYGLYDMSGNVWEWCLDAYDENFYFSSPARNPLSDVGTLSNAGLIINNYADIQSNRVLRGGSWSDSARWVRCSPRYWDAPAYASHYYGFRCVKSVRP